MLSVLREHLADYKQYLKDLPPRPPPYTPEMENRYGKIWADYISEKKKKEPYSVFSTWLPAELFQVPAQSNPTYCSCLCRPSVQGKRGTEVVLTGGGGKESQIVC